MGGQTFAAETSATGRATNPRLLGVAWSPDGDRIAVAADGNGVVLSAIAGAATSIPLGRDVRVSTVAFSPDARRLVAGTAGGQLLVWNLAEPIGAPVMVSAHRATVTSLLFAHGILASSSLDGEVKVWKTLDNLQDQQPLTFAHGAWVWAVAASADGGQVYSAGADRRVRAWTTNARVLADEACRRVGRNLTQVEWNTHVSSLLPYAATCPAAARRSP